jgi:FMN phosphatase YigB (HAD superfamily)
MKIAIGFDLDRTLGSDNHLERDVLIDMLAKTGNTDSSELQREVETSLARYRTGELPMYDALAELFRSRFGSHVNAFKKMAEFHNLTVAGVLQHVRPFADLHVSVARIRATGAAVAVLTKGWNPLQREKMRALGISLPLIVSDDIGARKPSVAAFAALRAVLSPADRYWFVGDDPHGDVAGARNAGFGTIWFENGSPWPSDLAPPDHQVRSLARVAELVEGFASADDTAGDVTPIQA